MDASFHQALSGEGKGAGIERGDGEMGEGGRKGEISGSWLGLSRGGGDVPKRAGPLERGEI